MNSRLRLSFLAGTAALAAIALSIPAALSQEDEELTFEQSIIRSLLGGGGGPGIDYRERSPLVIPPAPTLPPPAAAEGARSSAAWPQDPDKRESGRPAARRERPRDANAAAEREARPLSPDELRRGRAAGAGRHQGPAQTPSDMEMGRPLRPDEIPGHRSLFSLFRSSNETATFAGEPERRKMTDPPAGYRTPARSQPYGGPGVGPAKVPTFYDRGTEMR